MVVVAVDIVVVITTSHCVFHYSTVVVFVVELACRYAVSFVWRTEIRPEVGNLCKHMIGCRKASASR